MIQQTQRQYYLDWIRVITILLVFLFHCARFFDYDDWHIKNSVLSATTNTATFFLAEWIMPIFFFISGAGTWYALQSKTAAKFITDRVKRILVPLVFGIFILSPHQVYLERLTHHQFGGSFIDFLPHYFSGWYGLGGNFAWMGLHLWYLLLLFVFSLLALPLFLLIKKYSLKYINANPSLFYLVGLIILLALPGCLLPVDGLVGGRMWGGWSMVEHLVLFISGFYAFSMPRIRALWLTYRYGYLTAALILTSINMYLFLHHIMFEFGSAYYLLKILLRAAVCYSWMFTILGFSQYRLNFTNNKLKYCNEAVLPFYILHQPVIILIGYFIVQWNLPVGVKYVLIGLSSFSVVILCYHFLIKNNSFLRFIFGLGKVRPSTEKK
ncbi:acyltransferase-like protein [Mucilaginibacter frigoritolerans]|uniref:Acyltransferase-like protein n=1 Tax=Mucilaginibacter frigoritolerans TaxID=652788 RepID=A0A562TWE9_9SPHI|nr:acyltransferase family protein [Mucilaginibacter frigoritolerans]TWI97180.1 acyltransferase-like protein [Mucilaginibacter frigoritolerans]